MATSPQPGRPERYDYEYERKGTCNLFGFFQPLQNWRHLKATEHRRSEDFALSMQYLVDVLFPEASEVQVVLDNLNTHTPTALYKTFEPHEALRIRRDKNGRIVAVSTQRGLDMLRRQNLETGAA